MGVFVTLHQPSKVSIMLIQQLCQQLHILLHLSICLWARSLSSSTSSQSVLDSPKPSNACFQPLPSFSPKKPFYML